MRDETTRSLRSLNLWWKDEERLSIPWRDRPSSAHPSSRYTLLSSATRRVTSVVRSEWGADGERVTTIPSHSLPTHDGLFLHFTSLRVERPSWVRQRSGVNEEGFTYSIRSVVPSLPLHSWRGNRGWKQPGRDHFIKVLICWVNSGPGWSRNEGSCQTKNL